MTYVLLLHRQPVIRQNGGAILLHTYCEQFKEIEKSFCTKSRHIKPPGSAKFHVEATFFGEALQKQDMRVRHTLNIFYKGHCNLLPRNCPLFFSKFCLGMSLICPLFFQKL